MSSTANRILEAVADYDGKHTSPLEVCCAALRTKNDFIPCLLALTASRTARQREACTWMLLQEVKAGYGFTPSDHAALAGLLGHYSDWPSQLHLCQLIDISAPPEELCDSFVEWLTPLHSHTRPFLRAWSLSALVRIAAAYPHHQKAAQTALTHAQNDKAASVRARARRLS